MKVSAPRFYKTKRSVSQWKPAAGASRLPPHWVGPPTLNFSPFVISHLLVLYTKPFSVYMRYITDFIILAQYKVHTPKVLSCRTSASTRKYFCIFEPPKVWLGRHPRAPNVGRHLQRTPNGKPRIPTRNRQWLTHRRCSLQLLENADEIRRLPPYLLYWDLWSFSKGHIPSQQQSNTSNHQCMYSMS